MSRTRERLTQWLPRSPMGRSIARLAGGTALGQMVSLAASPVVTRLYSTADFGVAGVFGSMLLVMLSVASLRYEMAIPLPERDADARALFRLSLGLVATISFLCAFLILPFRINVSNLVGSPRLADYLWLFPIGLLLAGTYQVLTYSCIRWKEFTVLASTKVRQGLAGTLTQIGTALLTAGPLGLILAVVVGQAFGVTRLWRGVRPATRLPPPSIEPPASIRAVALAYRRFPGFLLLATLINTLSMQAPVVVVSSAFGESSAGQYALAFRMLQVPITLIGAAIGQVFLSDISRNLREGTLTSQVSRALRQLSLFAFPISAALCVAADETFSLIFSAKWEVAGRFTQWLAPWFLLVFISSPISPVPSALQRQRGELLFQASLLVARIASFTLGILRQDLMLTVILFGAVSAAWWAGYLVWASRLAGQSVPDLRRLLLQRTLAVLPSILVLVTLRIILPSSPLRTLLLPALAALMALATIWWLIRGDRQHVSTPA